MAHERKIRPRKALTRKDFRYKRDWRYQKEEQAEKKSDEPAFEMAFVMIYVLFFIIGFFPKSPQGIQHWGTYLIVGMVGLVISAWGGSLMESEDEKRQKIGLYMFGGSFGVLYLVWLFG